MSVVQSRLGPHGRKIADGICRGPDGSPRPSLANMAAIKLWTEDSSSSHLPVRRRTAAIRHELLGKYNEFRLACQPPQRRLKEWPGAALERGCPVKVSNWPDNCRRMLYAFGLLVLPPQFLFYIRSIQARKLEN